MAAQITPLPTPPTPADSPADFNTKAFALLGGLPLFVTEANGLGDEVNQLAYAVEQNVTAAQSAKNDAIDANTQAQLAKSSASASAGAAGTSAGAAANFATAANLSAQAAAESAQSVDHAYLRDLVQSSWAGKSILSGEDLNTYTTPGRAYCSSNAIAASLLNCPTAHAFILDICYVNATSFVQTLTTYRTGTDRRIFQRAISGGVFGDWIRIYTQIDPPTDLVNLNLQSLNTGQIGGIRNRLIDGGQRINQSNFGGDWSGVAVNSYGFDIWKKLSSTTKGQIIEAGFFKPSTVHTLSGAGVTTSQITSPASGNWTVSVPLAATNVMLEEGTTASTFELIDDSLELMRVRRYYEVAYTGGASYAASASQIQRCYAPWSVFKRAAPSVAGVVAAGDATSPSPALISSYGALIAFAATAASQYGFFRITADIRL